MKKYNYKTLKQQIESLVGEEVSIEVAANQGVISGEPLMLVADLSGTLTRTYETEQGDFYLVVGNTYLPLISTQAESRYFQIGISKIVHKSETVYENLKIVKNPNLFKESLEEVFEEAQVL